MKFAVLKAESDEILEASWNWKHPDCVIPYEQRFTADVITGGNQMLDLLEIVFEILEMIFDHHSKKEAKANHRASAIRRSGQPMPDSNRIATNYGGESASMPDPYTVFDQWHSM